ncbi:hypothetical protein AAZX31_16G070000 [Glycine max]
MITGFNPFNRHISVDSKEAPLEYQSYHVQVTKYQTTQYVSNVTYICNTFWNCCYNKGLMLRTFCWISKASVRTVYSNIATVYL